MNAVRTDDEVLGEPGPSWAPGYVHATGAEAPIDFGFRSRPEDFVVEEIPSRAPSGGGVHCWFRIEKRGISTREAIRRLALAFGRAETEFGFAGRKDAQAIARQWLSIEHADERVLEALAIADVRIDAIARHSHKLRLGELAGNRFRLRLRDIGAEGVARARRVLEQLVARGVPNYVGAQRFGRSGTAWRLGRLHAAGEWHAYLLELLRPEHTRQSVSVDALRAAIEKQSHRAQRHLARIAGELESDLAPLARQLARRPKAWDSAVRAIPRATQSMHLAAFQSRVFNRVLARRGARYDEWLAGDVAWEHASGATTLVEVLTPGLELLRARLEASPSGPLFGPRMLAAAGEVGAAEEAALAAEGLAPADLAPAGRRFGLRGARRPLRVPLAELSLTVDGLDAWLAFRLPPGAYATTVVEEVAKSHARSGAGLQSGVPPADGVSDG